MNRNLDKLTWNINWIQKQENQSSRAKNMHVICQNLICCCRKRWFLIRDLGQKHLWKNLMKANLAINLRAIKKKANIQSHIVTVHWPENQIPTQRVGSLPLHTPWLPSLGPLSTGTQKRPRVDSFECLRVPVERGHYTRGPTTSAPHRPLTQQHTTPKQ